MELPEVAENGVNIKEAIKAILSLDGYVEIDDNTISMEEEGIYSVICWEGFDEEYASMDEAVGVFVDKVNEIHEMVDGLIDWSGEGF